MLVEVLELGIGLYSRQRVTVRVFELRVGVKVIGVKRRLRFRVGLGLRSG